MFAGTRKHCEQKARTDWSPIGKTRPVPVGSLVETSRVRDVQEQPNATSDKKIEVAYSQIGTVLESLARIHVHKLRSPLALSKVGNLRPSASHDRLSFNDDSVVGEPDVAAFFADAVDVVLGWPGEADEFARGV